MRAALIPCLVAIKRVFLQTQTAKSNQFMDIQRSAILGAILIVCWLLVIEWRDFKTQQLPPIVTNQSNLLPTADFKGSSPNMDHSDIPQVPTENIVDGNDEKSALIDSVANSNEQLIRVTTDVLDFVIDKTGGDIVSLSLPKHYAKIDTPDIPFNLLRRTNSHTYIAQSGLIGKNGTDTQQGRPTFTSQHSSYQLSDADNQLTIDLIYQQSPEVTITKRFILKRGDYLIELEYLINNQSAAPWEANLFAQIKRDSYQPVSEAGSMGLQPYTGAALRTNEQRYKKVEFEDLQEKSFKEVIQGGWIALVQHYFVTAWIPDPEQLNTYKLRKVKNQDLYLFGLTSSATQIPAGESGAIKFSYYAGPKDQYRLEQISEGLDLTIDYGWLWFVAQPLFALMTFYATGSLHLPFDITLDLFSGIGNWGFTIILLTITVKAAFFHLSATSYRSMANMRRVQPKMLEIKEKYGDNRQKMSEETMKLYRDEKVNPLGGCLPILVQMPVFIALYWVLLESVELRHAPFIGYIKDLSVMDPYFLMPIIMGVTMYIQQKLNPPPPDPMQAKVMQWMPVIFTFFFLWFPAGLVLYWVVNNSLSILQQWVITRQIENSGSN